MLLRRLYLLVSPNGVLVFLYTTAILWNYSRMYNLTGTQSKTITLLHKLQHTQTFYNI